MHFCLGFFPPCGFKVYFGLFLYARLQMGHIMLLRCPSFIRPSHNF
jgi:hypothetical protein